MREGAVTAALALAALALCPAAVSGASPELEAGTGRGQLLRVIDDPAAGVRWLLYEDAQHAGRPGRMVEVRLGASASAPFSAGGQNASDLAPVVRAGDRLTVEEHTAVDDANLAAVALGGAFRGQQLSVRLEMGGKVVRAVAEGPGRARLLSEPGAQP